ncbi:DNA-binding response regulator [Actinomyces oris]|uniref:response regulator transcription factor n=1 Tax=Actinomyces oris TaxID=544580 RepID=UPI000C78E501|nr:response regulator transcription factor [Actinomyces oris]PKY74218.1 DNA-binding response regulator [Actinomyces oris]
MRVLIVDDDALVAQSLSTILSVEDDVEVVGLGCSGPEATERYRELTPDILLMDIQMPGGDGLSAAERILAEDAGARIVFLTTFSDDEYIVRALKMGARGYLIKQDVAQVAPALRSVMAGVCVLEGEVLERSTTMGLGGPAGGREQAEEGPGPTAKDLRSTAFAALTDREYEVVEAVAEGLDNAEAAARLFMSEGTVRNHISAILAKLGLRNRTQVAVMYYRSAQAG